MRVRKRPVRSMRSSGPQSGRERPVQASSTSFVAAVLVLALSGCAGQLPAPVETRGDEVPAGNAATGTPRSDPGVAAVPSGRDQSLAPPSTEDIDAADSPVALPGSPDGEESPVEYAELAPKRLVAPNPAIMELLNDANRHSAEGRHDSAAAALERALKIEPNDAALWHRLARTRLDQGRVDLAEALAAKSNSLAVGDPNLQAQNWRVIAKARRKQGDVSGVEEALSRAARLVQ